MNERERIEKILVSEGMTAKQFAQEVGIQAGTISNIMNGRNNPSLDVMQRILNRFRTIQSDWLILGVGSMYRQQGERERSSSEILFEEQPTLPFDSQKSTDFPVADKVDSTTISPIEPAIDTTSSSSLIKKPNNPSAIPSAPSDKHSAEISTNKHIDRIVVFYTDSTYETFYRNL